MKQTFGMKQANYLDMSPKQKNAHAIELHRSVFKQKKNVRLHQWTRRGIEPQSQKWKSCLQTNSTKYPLDLADKYRVNF